MKVNILKNYEEMSNEAANLIAEVIREKPNALICFAAGSTPIRTFEILVDSARKKQIDFSACNFVGLDEWVGMDKNDKGSCQETLYRTLYQPLQIHLKNICFFNAKSNELQLECKRVDEFIFEKGNIDLMLLGLGVNGHLGFNEPGVSFTNLSHVVELNETTKLVGQKYFEKNKVLSKGITIGIHQILATDKVVLIANGANKAHAIQEMIHGDVTNNLPASILQTHQECYVILDEDAALLIK